MGKAAVISLNGIWNYLLDPENSGESRRFSDPGTDVSGWPAMEIPNNWQLAGVDNYSGVVWFRRTFFLPDEFSGKHIVIRFNGVDYYARVWLNGRLLGEHEGYFQPFEFTADAFVRWDGPNTLVVRVDAPKEEPDTKWPGDKRLIKGIFSHHDTRPGSWNLETGQNLGTGGIWNDVELVAADDIRITGLHATPTLLADGTARTQISLSIANYSLTSQEAQVQLTITPDNFAGARLECPPRKVWLHPGVNKLNLVESVAEPHLWWTWDQGEPNLYRVEVTVRAEGVSGAASAGAPASNVTAGVNDTATARFGFRSFSADKDGNWYLNGRRIFIRGTNIIPTQWLSEYTREKIAADIALLRKANINGIRVHAHVNRRELYEACDEAGILVWQDFALQWSYAETRELVDSAISQITDMVNLLYNHPSICIWCCHNEPSVNQESLDCALYDTVRALDSSRVIKSHSDFAEHPYFGWYYGHMEEYRHTPRGPLVSEYGAQALPNLETMKAMFGEDQLWPPDWQKWAYHDFQYDQTFNVAGVDPGRSIDDFIRNSQVYQARVLKFATESYRRAKFTKIASIFQFMFVDCWPSITWSVVDYHRRPKQGYHALQRAFQPVLPCAVREREKLVPGQQIFKELWVVNDLNQPFPGAVLEVTFEDEKGAIHLMDTLTVDIPKNEAALVLAAPHRNKTWVITESMPAGNYTLKLILKSKEGELLGENIDPAEVVGSQGVFDMKF